MCAFRHEARMMTKTASLITSPYENLKGFAMSRPPVIIFMICIALISVILMTLACIVKDNELKKPDVSQDWNVFLESFAELEFCIQANHSIGASATTSYTVSRPNLSTTPAPPDFSLGWNMVNVRNYSVSMMLAVQPTLEFVSIPHNVTYLTGVIAGSEIGLHGLAADEPIYVTMQLPYEWNITHCHSSGRHGCSTVHIYTCVHFQASDFVFPPGRSPEVCESVNDTGIIYQAQIVGHKSKFYPYRCRTRPVIHISYRLDPTLTVMLSLSDRSLINLHLLHTSYFLFVMTITVLIYAIVRGHPAKMKMTHASPLSSVTSSL